MKFLQYLKEFLFFARAAAPIAAEVARNTGNDEVVGDIEKAGKAAEALNTTVTRIEERK